MRGEALSCVVIDRLPFAAPGDPVVQARIESLRQRGEDPFLSYQLPHAVIALKQGVGRLIRDVTDRGVLVLGDPRIVSKFYGRVSLDSLPPMPRTRNVAPSQKAEPTSARRYRSAATILNACSASSSARFTRYPAPRLSVRRVIAIPRHPALTRGFSSTKSSECSGIAQSFDPLLHR